MLNEKYGSKKVVDNESVKPKLPPGSSIPIIPSQNPALLPNPPMCPTTSQSPIQSPIMNNSAKPLRLPIVSQDSQTSGINVPYNTNNSPITTQMIPNSFNSNGNEPPPEATELLSKALFTYFTSFAQSMSEMTGGSVSNQDMMMMMNNGTMPMPSGPSFQMGMGMGMNQNGGPIGGGFNNQSMNQRGFNNNFNNNNNNNNNMNGPQPWQRNDNNNNNKFKRKRN
jgi:hypothetical protein